MIYRKMLMLITTALLTSAAFATECNCAPECPLSCSVESEQVDVQEEKFFHMKKLMFEKVKENENTFDEIRRSDDSFVEKYLQYTGIMFPLQMSAMKESGLQDSMEEFREIMLKYSGTKKAKQLDLELFDYIGEKVFGVEDIQSLTKETAEKISARSSEEFRKPEFMSRLQELASEKAGDCANCMEFSDGVKNCLRWTIEKQLEILSEFGLDKGVDYLRYGRYLCEHQVYAPCCRG
ncbi:MAG: hypothetical protein S4CHLAM37_15060 [Chlamydiia bacterium]|nr:hypothetical protein [Chlamydiia bacterium]